jgi:hypothetical protein
MRLMPGKTNFDKLPVLNDKKGPLHRGLFI